MEIKKPLRVVHTADIQIEVRNSHHRFDEYTNILDSIYKQIKSTKAELYIIAGDIFEHNNPNDIERSIFINHLKNVLLIDSVMEIAIIDGNHDINQRKASNYYNSLGKPWTAPSAIDSIVAAIGDSRISYMNKSKLYDSCNIEGLSYIVWSQLDKHASLHLYGGEESNYRPFDISTSNETIITLFHDPVNGCINFDGKELRTNNDQVSLGDFVTKTVFAGDIHKPQCIQRDDITFIYPSSPAPRNFGEGDYYEDGVLVNSASQDHCIHTCILNQDGTISNSNFVKISQDRIYVTLTISNKINVDDILKLPFELTNTSLNNFIKVKLPCASESYVALEQDIRERIYAQNMFLNTHNITFHYGNGDMGYVVDDIAPSVNINQLITHDKILEISENYITKTITNSRSIHADDKPHVIEFMNKLFHKEFNNTTHNVTTNNIKLSQININNFMAFGDDVIVNFDNLSGIIRLTGGNGVGKTTLYKAIKWLLTGYISSNQNRTKKTENNLLIFNDYRYDVDRVNVTMYLSVNNVDIKICREIERIWKRNVTDEQKKSSSWKSYIASTANSLTIIDEDNQTYIDEGAESLLFTLFGGLENLERIVFADQFTLKNFVCSETSKLNEEILNYVGMNFFDSMINRYDALRTEEFVNIPKPAATIDQLNQIIIDNQSKILDINDEIHGYESATKDMIALNTTVQLEIDKLYTQLIPNLLSYEDAISKESQYQNEIIKISELIDTELIDIQSKKSMLGDLGVVTIYDDRVQMETQLSNENAILSALRLEHANYCTTRQEYITKLLERKNEINANVDAKLQKISELISTKNNECANIKLQQQQLVHEQTIAVQTKRAELQNNQTAIVNELNSIAKTITDTKQTIDSLLKQIDNLKNSSVCPTCKRSFDDTTINQINAQIDSIQKQINEYNNILLMNQNKSDSITKGEYKNNSKLINDIEELNYECVPNYDSYAINISNCESRIDILCTEIDKLNYNIQELNDSKQDITNTDELYLKLQKECKDVIANIVKLDDAINKSTNDIITYTNNLSTINATIDKICGIELEIGIIDNRINSYRESITNYKNNIDKIVANLADIEYNEKINKSIIDLISKRNAYNKAIDEHKDKVNELKVIVNAKTTTINNTNDQIQQVIAYRIVECSLKQYKALIGKNGLSKYIFGIVKDVLNSKLNDLLEDLNFRLRFMDDNSLAMFDLSVPNQPIREPHQLSGMQTCFAALSLVYVSRMCNNAFIFDHIFIDEVSGQLNDGTNLSYDSVNYQKQLKYLLAKFINLNVWVVDHVIDDLGESHVIEAIPSNNGVQLN